MVSYVWDGNGKSFLGRENMKGRRRGETIVFSEHVVTIVIVFIGREYR